MISNRRNRMLLTLVSTGCTALIECLSLVKRFELPTRLLLHILATLLQMMGDFHISSLQPCFLLWPKYSQLQARHYFVVIVRCSVTQTLIQSFDDSKRGWLWWLFTSFILPASWAAGPSWTKLDLIYTRKSFRIELGIFIFAIKYDSISLQ